MKLYGKSGIYKIVNLVNGKYYIGSAVNLGKRKLNHWSDLRTNKSRSPYLQRAWNKHGEKNFRFRVLFFCEPNDTLLYEQRCLDILCPFDRRGYNIRINAESALGIKWTKRQRMNYRKARLGIPTKKRSAETRKRMSEGAKNRPPVSDETRRRLSESHKGQIPAHKGKKFPAVSRGKYKPYPAFINAVTGETIPAGVGMVVMCKERELHPGHMGSVKVGKLRHHKNWMLLEKANA